MTSTTAPRRSPRPATGSRLARALAATALAGVVVLAPGATVTAIAVAAQPDDGLGQTIDPDQTQGTGQVVLDAGHVDMGPTLATGEWRLQLHDDTSTPRYWRDPSDVVLQVSDASLLTIPDDEAYAFLGIDAGSEVHVVPQTQAADVVWLGWNTQEPAVLDALQLGATLSMTAVEGPGDVDVFLQSGNFGEPEPLWDSSQPFPQDAFIERNIHAHANWVFSEPGVYLVEMEFSADLVSGESVSARDTLRFAVGDATDAESAFALELAESTGSGGSSEDPGSSGSDEATDAPGSETASGSTGLVLGIVAGVVVLAVLVAVVVVLVASRRARARALEARQSHRSEQSGHGS